MSLLWITMLDLTDYLQFKASEAFVAEFGDCGQNFTVAQKRIVRTVDRLTRDRQDGISLRELAGTLGITPGAASTSVDLLVKRDLLDRHVNPDDRRAVNITLSARLRRLCEKLIDGFDDDFAEIAGQLSKRELAACLKTCGLVSEKINRTMPNFNEKEG
ncbi:MAG: MarR family transcriptional regulator [Victivallaceae bacterium]|nr:MarR family transcriptional regulator [Victivallaceae bacterium]